MCLIVVLGIAFPRVALFLTWLFTNRIDRAFDGFVLPILGFLLLPYTTLFYVIAYAPHAHLTGIGWIFVIFGFLLDLSSHSGTAQVQHWRYDRRSR